MGVKEVGVIVDACENAISKLDGREIWSLAPDGSLTSTGSSKCLGAKQIQNGAGPELLPCDAVTVCFVLLKSLWLSSAWAPAILLVHWWMCGKKQVNVASKRSPE